MDDAHARRSWPIETLWAAARAPEFSLFVGIAVSLAVIFGLDRSGSFFSESSRWEIFHQVALYGVLAVGVAVVIIAGGIDLSIGSVVALSSIVCAKLLMSWLRNGETATGPPPLYLVALAVGLTLLMGAAIGLLHALMINSLGLPPFIATLATMAGFRGLAAILSGNHSITVKYDVFRTPGNNPVWTLAVFAVVALAASVMMGTTVLGRHLFALGGNEAAARLSGLPTRRLKSVAYAIAGMLSALGGVLFAGRQGAGDPQMGIGYELIAITGAVVGGCSLSGGVGSIRGTVLGLVLIQIVIKATGLLAPEGIDSTQVEGLVLGTVVVLAVAFNQRFRGRG